jgi:hypothetical protein
LRAAPVELRSRAADDRRQALAAARMGDVTHVCERRWPARRRLRVRRSTMRARGLPRARALRASGSPFQRRMARGPSVSVSTFDAEFRAAPRIDTRETSPALLGDQNPHVRDAHATPGAPGTPMSGANGGGRRMPFVSLRTGPVHGRAAVHVLGGETHATAFACESSHRGQAESLEACASSAPAALLDRGCRSRPSVACRAPPLDRDGALHVAPREARASAITGESAELVQRGGLVDSRDPRCPGLAATHVAARADGRVVGRPGLDDADATTRRAAMLGLHVRAVAGRADILAQALVVSDRAPRSAQRASAGMRGGGHGWDIVPAADAGSISSVARQWQDGRKHPIRAQAAVAARAGGLETPGP